jgi:pSer/pThr/pTyr-binding forkhead associated (FHA) protein
VKDTTDMAHGFPAHSWSPSELKHQIEAERRGEPFLIYRDGDGSQRVIGLGQGSSRITVGRTSANDVQLGFDTEVSRLHAELERIGDAWTLSDDGLSRNGSFVNGERVVGRRRLEDGDALRFGGTLVVYRAPADAGIAETDVAADVSAQASLSETQRRILIALCRPFKDGAGYATPATNRQIAAEVFLSVDAVKAQLRSLFEKFDVGALPQNQKRVRLAERAFQSGAVAPRDL